MHSRFLFMHFSPFLAIKLNNEELVEFNEIIQLVILHDIGRNVVGK